jgi:hypothetical protein
MADQLPPDEQYPGQNIQRSLPGVNMMLMIQRMLQAAGGVGDRAMQYLRPGVAPAPGQAIPTPRDAQGRPLPIDPATGRPVGQ